MSIIMIRLLFLLCLSSLIATAENGDTTYVQVHDNTDMTWYGHYKDWGEFPSGDESYRKVLMHFTMGCASTGCSGWDYDVHILMRNRTGVLDSNIVLAPSFKLNNEIVDTATFSYSPTFTNSWDSVNGTTPVANDTMVLLLFADQDDPFLVTDTQYVFAADYYNPTYDSLGVITDSTLVVADTTLYLSNTVTYNVFEVIEDFELGRAITPYGTYMNPANGSYGTNGYDENWKHIFTYDVTDFQHLLKDSVEIDAFYAGWSSGFSVKLDFEFIEGTPPRTPLKLSNVYKNGASGYGYSNSNSFETTQMPETKVALLPSAQEYKLQFVPSGHGQAGEFTSGVSYTAKVNGSVVGGNTIWKDDCGFNAIWPQGGTWIFDRANWCPGEAVPIYNHEITPYVGMSLDSVAIDINFSNYNPNGDASYSCAVHLFQYTEPNFTLDAEITDILAPSKKDVYSRFNPICSSPIIKIRNSGKDILTSVDIQYGVKGGTMQTYEWTGNLKFMEEEEVTLDPMIHDGNETKFVVTLSNPNGSTDTHSDNDTMESEFEDLPIYKPSFLVRLKTNNYGSQSSWTIKNSNNEVVYSRDNCANNTLYNDTVTLGNGCYTFKIDDTGGDGLDFWYWDNVGQPDGSGFINFMYYDTISVFRSFNKDFGSAIVHSFRVTNGVSVDNHTMINFDIYPSVSDGKVFIQKDSSTKTPSTIEVYSVNGQKIIEEKWEENTQLKTLHLGSLSDGIYVVKVQTGDIINTQKIILNR
ncbi:peptide-N-glycosidase F-related protein [Flavobacteriales bacterium]|nr:peptide-N-glycosidase F-related protein [Flavobacteriales bacterium]